MSQKGEYQMDTSKIKFSNLTNDQLQEIQALESRINLSKTEGPETILIAYATPK